MQQPSPSSGTRLTIRARTAGVVVAGLAALAAAAALLTPAPIATSERSASELAPPERGSTLPVASGTPVAASGRVIEQTGTTLDDDVPPSSDVARSKAAGGPCNHAL